MEKMLTVFNADEDFFKLKGDYDIDIDFNDNDNPYFKAFKNLM